MSFMPSIKQQYDIVLNDAENHFIASRTEKESYSLNYENNQKKIFVSIDDHSKELIFPSPPISLEDRKNDLIKLFAAIIAVTAMVALVILFTAMPILGEPLFTLTMVFVGPIVGLIGIVAGDIFFDIQKEQKKRCREYQNLIYSKVKQQVNVFCRELSPNAPLS